MTTTKSTKRTGPLPFITDLQTPRGRHIERNYFDVPDQTYGDGWSTGMEAAAQFVDALRDEGESRFDPLMVLEAVAQVLVETHGGAYDRPSRRGAAAGFLRMIEASLRWAAKSADLGDWIRAQREAYERSHAELVERERVERLARAREFVERMRTAKAARRRRPDAGQHVLH